jgi:WD40 repeat protein
MIHLYTLGCDGAVQLRLIGHLKGITALRSFDDKELWSGSADKVIKKWDVGQGVCSAHCERHGGKVTTIWQVSIDRSTYLFSGGIDNIVRVWDMSRQRAMFSINLGDSMVPRAISTVVADTHCHLSIVVVRKEPTDKTPDPSIVSNSAQVQIYPFFKA